jgi:phosphohistidine phosphatase
VLSALGQELEVRIEPSLYTFDGAALLDRLRVVPEGVASVMLIGHNPAIQELFLMLVARGDRLDELAEKFPTAALAEIEFPSGPWHEVDKTLGELTQFVVPRELG